MSCDHGDEDENGIEGFDPTCSDCVGDLEEQRIDEALDDMTTHQEMLDMALPCLENHNL